MEQTRQEKQYEEKVVRVALVLIGHFDKISAVVARVTARSLIDSLDWTPEFYHNGAKDREALRQLVEDLQEVEETVGSLSPWMQQTLNLVLQGELADEVQSSVNRDSPRPPVTVEELLLAMNSWKAAATGAERIMENGRPSHGKNWRAVVIIDEARRVWKVYKGKTPPRKKLNELTVFAEFLRNIFEAVGVAANVGSAYDAWYLYASDPDSLFDAPELL